MKKLLLLAMVLGLLISGCASAKWYKEGVSFMDKDREWNKCSPMTTGDYILANIPIIGWIYCAIEGSEWTKQQEECMREKGFQTRK